MPKWQGIYYLERTAVLKIIELRYVESERQTVSIWNRWDVDEIVESYKSKGFFIAKESKSIIIFAKPAQVIITVKENNGKCNRGDFKNQIKEFYNKKSISYETFLRFMGDYGTGRVEILRNERGKYYIHRVEPE